MLRTKTWTQWKYDNNTGTYYSCLIISPKQINEHYVSFDSSGWVQKCTVPHESKPFISANLAMENCEIFEQEMLEERERYEFDLDRKADD